MLIQAVTSAYFIRLYSEQDEKECQHSKESLNKRRVNRLYLQRQVLEGHVQ
jgi:hypothetical protein